MNSLLFHAENGRVEPGSFYPCNMPAIVRVEVSVAELALPAHGTTLYAETDIIWCASSDTWEELGMFPELRLPGQLDRAPAVRPQFT
ncbi:MAG: hypothetical protein QGF67_17255 [Lentisphaeria bacterium]|jgi:hypothetical protein|nr:hypothetical protein [Lentisphaeria bacterium]MDP7743189.1 hypothetical protein [Lentisphaeria bacterium]